MSELSEKQQHYARYLAKLPAAQRNMLFSKMKPDFKARLQRFIAENISEEKKGLSAQQIAALEPVVRKMYLHKLKVESPLKHAFLAPMVDQQKQLNREASKGVSAC